MSFDLSKVETRHFGFPEGEYTITLTKVKQDTTSQDNDRVRVQLRIKEGQRYANRVIFGDLVVTEKTLPFVKGRYQELTGEELTGKFQTLKTITTAITKALTVKLGQDYTAHLREVNGLLEVVGEYKLTK